MSIPKSYSEVRAVIERLEYTVSDAEVRSIARELDKTRKKLKARGGWCCLKPGGNGVFTWVQSRCNERRLTHRCSGAFAVPSGIITARFHFEAWDEEQYGPWKRENSIEFAIESRNVDVKRSPLSRIGDASPINSVARKIAGDGDRPCPYCNRYFRNPAAMALHIEESHAADCVRRAKVR